MADEIYLDPAAPAPPPNRRPLTGRQRLAVLAGLLAVIGLVAVIQRNRHDAPPAMLTPAGAAETPAWPTAPGPCGNRVEVPLIDSAASRTAVIATVPLTGTRPGQLDLATGLFRPTSGLRLDPQHYVSQQVQSGSSVYSLVRNCEHPEVGVAVRSQLGHQQDLTFGRTYFALLSDGRGGVWGESYAGAPSIPPEAAIGATVERLDRPSPAIALPSWFTLLGLYGNTAIGISIPTPVRSTLYLYDLSTRRLRSLGPTFGTGWSQGSLIWTATACSATGPCTVRTYRPATGASTSRDYHLPLETTFAGAVLDPSRDRVGFVLQRETTETRYRSQASTTPADLAILDLATGVIDPVPDLELAPGARPGILQFSQDGYLLVGFARIDGTDIYAWRPGLSRPIRLAGAN